MQHGHEHRMAVREKVVATGVPFAATLCLAIAGCSDPAPPTSDAAMTWLAGDHHVHSRYSVLWDRDVDPPEPRIGAHGVYPIALNALMARHYGLAWMVTTDHGGRLHSKLYLDEAYPNLQVAREVVPEIIQFHGVELNTPGGDHSSVIFPHSHDEAQRLYEFESRFDRRNAGPSDPDVDTEARMLEALRVLDGLPEKPVVIANHPSRTAMGGESYGAYTPEEFRSWNDTAPDVAVGMVGSPGHQALSINRDGSLRERGTRGQYSGVRTRGGFDPMTSILGGLWDSMLGEGRRWWITANSDSHRHWSDGGPDFWPGEYSMTHVYSRESSADILEALRSGRIFVATGGLVSELYVNAATTGGNVADIGGTLRFEPGESIVVMIRLRDPAGQNPHGDSPGVSRVDLISGDITGPVADRSQDTNPTTRIIRRFEEGDWTRDGEFIAMTERLDDVSGSLYLRVRGTNTTELEPAEDTRGEDPWTDLWFYSNPIFVEVD